MFKIGKKFSPKSSSNRSSHTENPHSQIAKQQQANENVPIKIEIACLQVSVYQFFTKKASLFSQLSQNKIISRATFV